MELIEKAILFLQYPEHWVTKLGGLCVAFLAAVLAFFVTGLVPADDIDWWWRVLLCGASAVLGLVIWAAVRWLYFLAGRGIRVAIAFDDFRIPGPELKRARQRIKEATAARNLEGKVCVRLFPRDKLTTRTGQRKVLESYGYSVAMLIKVAPNAKTPDHLDYAIDMMTPENGMDEEWRQATFRHMATIVSRPASINTLADVVDVKMARLFDIILLALAVNEYHGGNMDLASRLSRCLDTSLSDSLPANRQPRRGVRWLDVSALTRPATVSARELWEGGHRLAKALNDGQVALERYGSDYPLLYQLMARNWFIRGDFTRAIEVNFSAPRSSLNSYERSMLTLNDAVIGLIQGKWAEAAVKYRDFFKSNEIKNYDLEELCDFAELSWHRGDSGAGFMYLLYCRLAGRPCPEGLSEQIQHWLLEERSREPLAGILRAYGRPAALHAAVSSRGEKKLTSAQKKRAERAKRRNKGD